MAATGMHDNRQNCFRFQFHHVLHNAGQDTIYDGLARDVVQGAVDGINGERTKNLTDRRLFVADITRYGSGVVTWVVFDFFTPCFWTGDPVTPNVIVYTEPCKINPTRRQGIRSKANPKKHKVKV